MFWPFSAHLSGRPVSCDTPSRFGPRASGQSPSATFLGPCADASRPALTTNAANNVFFRFFIALLAVTPVDHRLFHLAHGSPKGLRYRSHRKRSRTRDGGSAGLQACHQNPTPKRTPNVLGAPFSPRNPDRAPGNGNAIGTYVVSK